MALSAAIASRPIANTSGRHPTLQSRRKPEIPRRRSIPRNSNIVAQNRTPSPALRLKEYASTSCVGRKVAPLASVTRQASKLQISNAKHALVGLENLGNTCFMNSCLQCLNNVPALSKYFFTGKHKTDVNEKSSTHGKLATAFGTLVESLWGGPAHSSTKPTELKHVVGKFASRFLGYDQQDAQEFLRFFLDGLHEDLNRIKAKPAYYEIKDRPDATDRSISDEFWKYYLERNSSAISELFCGQLQSEVICQTCSHRSVCYDVFWDLSIPIPRKSRSKSIKRALFSKDSGCTLEECLETYVGQEELKGNDSYYCSKCKTHRPVTKTMSLYRAPQVLVIHLKRFSFTTFSREKVNTNVIYPTKDLDLDPYFAKEGVFSKGSNKYRLTGIVNHMGSLNGGHYTADCLNSESAEWFNYNDASVSATELSDLGGQNAYMLFYEKQ